MEGQGVVGGLAALAALEHRLQRGEIRVALRVIGDDLAVDQAGWQVQRLDHLDEGPELVGPVLAIAGEDRDVGALRRDQRAITVEFDLVHPVVAGGHGIDQGRELR